MNKLTKKQRELLNSLKENGTLFVGYSCLTLMNTFDRLVTKGYATVEQDRYGKHYTAKE